MYKNSKSLIANRWKSKKIPVEMQISPLMNRRISSQKFRRINFHSKKKLTSLNSCQIISEIFCLKKFVSIKYFICFFNILSFFCRKERKYQRKKLAAHNAITSLSAAGARPCAPLFFIQQLKNFFSLINSFALPAFEVVQFCLRLQGASKKDF